MGNEPITKSRKQFSNFLNVTVRLLRLRARTAMRFSECLPKRTMYQTPNTHAQKTHTAKREKRRPKRKKEKSKAKQKEEKKAQGKYTRTLNLKRLLKAQMSRLFLHTMISASLPLSVLEVAASTGTVRVQNSAVQSHMFSAPLNSSVYNSIGVETPCLSSFQCRIILCDANSLCLHGGAT